MSAFIILVVGLIFLFLIISLRGRVARLEEIVKSGNMQTVARVVSSEQSVPKTSSQSSVQVRPAPQALLDFINAHNKQGTPRAQISSVLIENGWSSADVENAFTCIDSGKQNNTASINQNIASPNEISAQIEPDAFERFASWLKEDWLMKLGGLLLLIGFGWLTSYAFIHDWIGPMGRIALGIIAGSLLIVLGWWRIQKYIHQGGVFMVIGSTTILITVVAARVIYNFFDPISALGIMFLSTVFVAVASVRFNNRALALASIILAGFAPIFTGSGSIESITLFSYLLVVILGTIWIVVLTGRRELTLAALLMASFYSLVYFRDQNIDVLLYFAYVFTLIFFITNTSGILKLKGKNIMPDLLTAAGNGLFLLLWILNAAPEVWKSLILSGWAVVFAVGAFIAYKITQRKDVFLVYVGVGIGLIAAATSVELSGAVLAIAFTIEILVLSLVTYILTQSVRVAGMMSILFMAPGLMSVGSIVSTSWSAGMINKDFFVLSILAISLLGLGSLFSKLARASTEEKSEDTVQLSSLLMIVGSAYVYILIWLSLHASLPGNQLLAVMMSLFVYTICGLVAYYIGLSSGKNGIKIYGGSLLGFVVIRLLIVDVWSMELGGRVVTFFIIGALLIATAFFKKNRGTTSTASSATNLSDKIQ